MWCSAAPGTAHLARPIRNLPPYTVGQGSRRPGQVRRWADALAGEVVPLGGTGRQGHDGLSPPLRTERPRPDHRRDAQPPESATHWSARRLARTTVQRIWAVAGFQAHPTETIKFSRGLDSRSRSATSRGSTSRPPSGRSFSQALERTQPMLPLRPGGVECRTHDYKRNGTTSLLRRSRSPPAG